MCLTLGFFTSSYYIFKIREVPLSEESKKINEKYIIAQKRALLGNAYDPALEKEEN